MWLSRKGTPGLSWIQGNYSKVGIDDRQANILLGPNQCSELEKNIKLKRTLEGRNEANLSSSTHFSHR